MTIRSIRIASLAVAATTIAGCGGWIVPSNSHSAPVSYRVLYDSEETGNGEIWAVNPDGTGKVNLTNASGDDEQPTAAWDGSVIYYWHDGQIWAMDPDGGNQHLVLDTSATGCFGLRVNRSNTKLVFYTISPTYEVWIVNTDGTGLTKLTDANTTGNGYGPTFNAAGTKIIFGSNRTGEFKLFTMNVDGSNETLLSTGAFPAQGPHVSPDGSRVLFLSNLGVYTMPIGGGSPQLVVDGVSNSSPGYAPNGEVVYIDQGVTDRTIHAIEADGTNDRLLATDPTGSSVSICAIRVP